jgi:hypothetical protein
VFEEVVDRTKVIDLRGSEAPSQTSGFGVLADPTGRRGRLLRRIGRGIALTFAAWLIALALAGVGLLPGAGIPLASNVGLDTPSGPPPIPAVSPLRTTAAAPVAAVARRPVSAVTPAASLGETQPTQSERRRTRNGAVTRPVRKRTMPVAAAATPGPPAVPPGHRTTTTGPGHSTVAPGQVRPAKKPTPAPTAAATPEHGRSGTAPGHGK